MSAIRKKAFRCLCPATSTPEYRRLSSARSISVPRSCTSASSNCTSRSNTEPDNSSTCVRRKIWHGATLSPAYRPRPPTFISTCGAYRKANKQPGIRCLESGRYGRGSFSERGLLLPTGIARTRPTADRHGQRSSAALRHHSECTSTRAYRTDPTVSWKPYSARPLSNRETTRIYSNLFQFRLYALCLR